MFSKRLGGYRLPNYTEQIFSVAKGHGDNALNGKTAFRRFWTSPPPYEMFEEML